MNPKQHLFRQAPRWIAWSLLLSLSLGLSGCFSKPSLTEKVQEPPYVPDLPLTDLPEALQGQPEIPSKTYDQFADLLEKEAHKRRHPRLIDAVARAVRIGVLTPAGPEDRFNPNDAITYGEFRNWALGYQNTLLLVGDAAQEASRDDPRNPASGNSPAAAVKVAAPAGKHPALAIPLIVPPEEMGWADHLLSASRPLTRQEFCGLMIFLSGQDAKARNLSAIEGLGPAGTDLTGGDETFGRFRDFAQIKHWARPYVGLAYQEHLIRDIFRLTPNQLTLGTGFEPFRAVTREEAIVFLDRLYGETAAAYAPPPERKRPEAGAERMTQESASDSDLPRPIGRLKQTHEQGPAGTRSTLQVLGPD